MSKRAELRGTSAIILVQTAKQIDAYFTGRVAYVYRVYHTADTEAFIYYIRDVAGVWLGSSVNPNQLRAQQKAFKIAQKNGFTQVLWVH